MTFKLPHYPKGNFLDTEGQCNQNTLTEDWPSPWLYPPAASQAPNQGRPAATDETRKTPMQLAKLLKLLTFLAVLAFVMSAAAQQIRYEDFSQNLNLLDMNGTVHPDTWNGLAVLRLTDGHSESHPNQGVPASSLWFSVPQPLSSGFTSYFRFVIHNPLTCCAPGDGLAFVMQSASYTDASLCASGAQGTAIGYAPGGLGYTGIPNSVAIEFDTHQDAWDPNANHVALQSCGANPNNPVHDSGEYTICSNNHVTSCPFDVMGTTIPPLGVACGNGGCIDGIPVTVVVEYTGTSKTDPHHLYVYVDPLLIPGTHTPVANATAQVNVPGFMIEKEIPISPTANGVTALVGFTASQASNSQTTDLITWEFTPHTPTQITEPLMDNGDENQFNFGDHVYGVTYPPNSFQGTFYMTVNAMPIDATTFYNTRLKNNTLFNNEQCITYLSTGGNCIVYEVTCQDSMHNNVSCPNPNENQLIATRTTYSTTDPVNANNADYIKAPIGTNSWCSIFTSFQQNAFDPTTSGHGNNFSDFVATFKTAPGQDPACQTSGSARIMLKKPAPTNAASPASNSPQEPGPAGSNK
jgi:Legume lectin domain